MQGVIRGRGMGAGGYMGNGGWVQGVVRGWVQGVIRGRGVKREGGCRGYKGKGGAGVIRGRRVGLGGYGGWVQGVMEGGCS